MGGISIYIGLRYLIRFVSSPLSNVIYSPRFIGGIFEVPPVESGRRKGLSDHSPGNNHTMAYSRVRLLLLAFITSVRQGSCECEDKLCISASYFSYGKVNILCTSNYTIDPNFEVQEHGNNYFTILSTSVLRQQMDYAISRINDSFFLLNVSNAVHHNGSLYRCFSHVGRDSAMSPLLQLVVAGEVNIPTSSSVSPTQGFTSVPVTNMATTPTPPTETNISDSTSVPVSSNPELVLESVVVPVIVIILVLAVAVTVIVVIFVIKCTRHRKLSSLTVTKNQNSQDVCDGPLSQLQSDANIDSNGTDFMNPTDDAVLDTSPPINFSLMADNTSSHTLTIRRFETREMELLPHSIQETEGHEGHTAIVGPQGIHLTRTRKETHTDSEEESFRTPYVNEGAGIKMTRSPAYEPIRRNTPEYVNDDVGIKMTRSPAYLAVERDIPLYVNDKERIKITHSPAYVAVERTIPEYVNDEERIKLTPSPAYVPIERITPKCSSSNSTDH